MFAVPFGRIVWKEYRANRGLWLSCLVMGALCQMIIWGSLLDPRERDMMLPGLASIFTVVYVVGCCAILFAGEREERTADWLLSLSVRPGTLLGAKVSFAIASAFTLQLALALLTVLLMTRSESIHVGILSPVWLVILLWGLLGSLFSRQVLMSVPVIAALCVAMNMTTFAIADGFAGPAELENSRRLIIFGIVLLVGAGIDFWVGWRWSQGKYLDFSAVVQQFVMRSRPPARPARRAADVPRAEFEQGWMRAWQRLAWQERRRVSYYWILSWSVILFGALSARLPLMLANQFERQSLATLMGSINSLIPLVIGLIAFRPDPQFNQLRFLAQRGLSPLGIWLTKHLIWIPRAFLLVVLSDLSRWTVDFLTFWMVPQSRNPLASVEFPQWNTMVWIVLLSYACGQLTAVLFERTIFALVCGLVLNSLVLLWFAETELMQVPAWWSLGGPLLGMFAMTLWQMKPWLLEQPKWPRFLTLGFRTAAFSCLLIGTLAGHRIYEVIAVQNLDETLLRLLRQPFVSNSSDNRMTATRTQFEQLGTSDEESMLQRTEQIVHLLQSKAISLSLERDQQLTPPKFIEQIHHTLQASAEYYLSSGQLDQALECHVANVRFANLLSQGEFRQWLTASYQLRGILQMLVKWANHPLQTAGEVRNGIAAIEVELNEFRSAAAAVEKTFYADRRMWVTSTRQQLIEEFSRVDTESKVWSSSSLHLVAAIMPWERYRADLLFARDATNKISAIRTLEQRLEFPGLLAARTVRREFGEKATRITQLNMTTPLVMFATIPFDRVLDSVLDQHTHIRAAIIRMELIAYRLREGKQPARLVELMGRMNDAYLVDPWADRFFEYYPTFLLSAGGAHSTLLPAASGKVEIVHEGQRQASGKVDFHLVTSQIIRTDELTYDGTVSACYFPIPIPPHK